jgi:hypothetical protein
MLRRLDLNGFQWHEQGMKKIILLVGTLAIAAWTGCATISAADQVKIRAAHDLRCDPDQVQTAKLDDHTMRVTACGQERTYVQECVSADTTRCTWVSRGAETTSTASSGAVHQSP